MIKLSEDNFWTGFAIGFAGPILGFVIFGLWYAHEFNTTFSVFFEGIFIGNSAFRSPVASVSLALNGLIFYIFSRGFKHKTMKGMLVATFLYVPVVLYLYFAK